MDLISLVASAAFILTQQTQGVMDPGMAIGLLMLFVLLLAGLACGVFDEEPKQPRQRTFDDYLEDLRQESEDYLDKVDRLYRNR